MKTFTPEVSSMPEAQDTRELPKKIILIVLFMAVAVIAFADSVHLFQQASADTMMVPGAGTWCIAR